MSDLRMTGNTAEEWRPVVGYEGLYEVSDQGRVRTVARTIVRRNGRIQPAPQRVLKLKLSPHGYWRIGLTNELAGRQRFHFVHRLVLAAFVGPCPEGMQCRHLDGNPANNAVQNLCWGTCSENNLDKLRHGTHPEARKTHCKYGHGFTEKNTRITPQGFRKCRECDRIRHRRAA